ncbi:hypothetical protein P175DRAFT_0451873 [Aspergillus ochraceoroseus IBT 24754]|uniref:Sulfotransferase domain-containing protein n=2 Tax=Aspergillus ochraceoroseus TaxID=138278 RepID=A0A2T5M9R2_9EURO|nr:uncharacterized protein P175DRAFT_0451873 [Aspergillus ochraceoroseus IBT 24754]KKK17197.1 hypothetical protein AOCH_003428 [Aspergillus ochraceoroseus]PTU25282.1 hypothetical protein P175DRAFT_0451873 [Aspergillus ochraceoroseus IBT 24754]
MAAINDPSSTPKPSRLFLVSMPRTASNLLVKMLNLPNQHQLHTNSSSGYFFTPAYRHVTEAGVIGKPLSEWPEDAKAKIQQTYQDCLDDMEECSLRAKEGKKIMFTKEHAFWFVNPAAVWNEPEHADAFKLRFPGGASQQTFSSKNKTVLSDEYLRTWQTAFLIRHPALVFPSFYRAMNKIDEIEPTQFSSSQGNLKNNMTLQWTRLLFDHCLEHSDESNRPVVIDALEVIHRPETVLKFCALTGLDPGVVQSTWEDAKLKPASACQENHLQHHSTSRFRQVMGSTFTQSKGVIKDKTPTSIDMKEEVEKWKGEFGEEKANEIEKAVWAAMPDYEYLRGWAIQG